MLIGVLVYELKNRGSLVTPGLRRWEIGPSEPQAKIPTRHYSLGSDDMQVVRRHYFGEQVLVRPKYRFQ